MLGPWERPLSPQVSYHGVSSECHGTTHNWKKTMTDQLEPSLLAALGTLRKWVVSVPSPFCPQEQTLQAWLAMAMVQEGYCKPKQILLEVTQGEEGETPRLPDIWDRSGVKNRSYVRYDLVVLSEDCLGEGRDFGSCRPHPQILVEIKALNTYGSLQRAMIRKDMDKLWLGREWWQEAHGEQVDTLMLVLATDAKSASQQTTTEKVRGWVEGFEGSNDVRHDIPVALLLRDEDVLWF